MSLPRPGESRSTGPGSRGERMSGYRFDRLKLLIVDDNAHMRKMLTTIVNAFGGRLVKLIFYTCDPSTLRKPLISLDLVGRMRKNVVLRFS